MVPFCSSWPSFKRVSLGSPLLGCDDSSQLTGDEIGRAGPLPAHAAVLSACQTAL